MFPTTYFEGEKSGVNWWCRWLSQYEYDIALTNKTWRGQYYLSIRCSLGEVVDGLVHTAHSQLYWPGAINSAVTLVQRNVNR